MTAASISKGMTIRSFDFAMVHRDGTVSGTEKTGERACYMEGIVYKIDGNMITIVITKRVFCGETDNPDTHDGKTATTPMVTRKGDRVEFGGIEIIG